MSRFGKAPVRLSPRHLDPKCLVFSMFTAEDIRNLSVTQLRTPLSFNVLGHPLKGGLYDPALGPLNEKSDPCGTCGSNVQKCPGHFGHIELPVPVVNPLFHKSLYTLIKLTCLKCFTLQIPNYAKLLLSAKLKLLQLGFLSELDMLEQEVATITANNPYLKEAEMEHIRDIVEDYTQNLLNKERFNQAITKESDSNLSTKNINLHWNSHVETLLRQFTVGKVCINCHEPIPKITTLRNKIMTTKAANEALNETSRGIVRKLETVLIMPEQSREYLRKLWEFEKETLKIIVPCLGMVDIDNPTDIFFFEVIPVLPPIVRPVNYLNGQMIEHPQSQVYKTIIQDCLVLRNIIQVVQDGNTDKLSEEGRLVFKQIKGESAIEKLHNAWQALQSNVDHLMDRELSKTSESANCQGLKQVIEKKEGVIRMHMMGKRVNFAARSVITPDPNLNIDEIGIPEAFAMKLTYPTPVTPWNVTELRQMVLNGPNVHPGAVMVEGEDGMIQRLNSENSTQRESIAKRLLTTNDRASKFFNGVKIVHRHLQNGDILLLNRQPTLHKPSIMAHKARILKGEKTLRLHYANCKAYNADFDGDEMNAHFPQNELARSEGYFIANVANQYLVPKDGTPLSGLIQDHIVSGVRLTMRGRFFTKEDYWLHVYTALSDTQGDVISLPPAILKPVPLWSGKQIVSTVIINVIPKDCARINLTSGSKISAKAWEAKKPRQWKCGTEFTNPKTMSEAEVVIRNGELLSGVLDKTHYGATSYGLIHCVFELYGGTCSGKLLSAFGKLFQGFLQREGFTLGVEDILIRKKADTKRTGIISKCRAVGEEVQRSALDLPEDTSTSDVTEQIEKNYWNNPKFRAQLDRKYKAALDQYTNDINKTCLPAGLLMKFPRNNLQLMVQSGAKGSTVNTMQISCLLGQIELEGKRPPLMISGKSLPSFPAYDPSPRAGGFIDGRFMTGIQPQEFFFHCMAGREGLIDTAVKTSRSGYLQRCLIKHLEGLTVNYDATVRDSNGSLIQINYGEDGLDIPKSQFLNKNQLPFLVHNKDAILDPILAEYLKSQSPVKKISRISKKIQKWEKKHGSNLQHTRGSGFTQFSTIESTSAKHKKIDRNSGRSKAALSATKKWGRLSEEDRQKYQVEYARCPDPVMSRFRQDIDFGVLSERLEKLVQDYRGSDISKEDLHDLVATKNMRTVCPPGEPVGLLAAQSIGEPSTQLTLNTFHFAGRGEMNVTLGIPRLREILMLASKNIKTPSMEIPLRADLPNPVKQANKLRLKLTKCVLSDVLKSIEIDRKMVHSPQRQLVYTLKINYLSHKNYKNEFAVKPRSVVEKTETMFFKGMFREIRRITKIAAALLHFEDESKGRREEDENARLDEDSPNNNEETGRGRSGRSDLGELHESSDEEEAAEDADATFARTQSRHQENQEYDEPEDDVEKELREDDGEVDDENARETETEGNKSLREESTDDENENEDSPMVGEEYTEERLKRKDYVINSYSNASDYDFDDRKFLWSKLTFWLPLKMVKHDLPSILRNVASKVVLWETPNIRKAFTFQNPSGETILKTDGVNIIEMFKYRDVLDLKRLYSNDIYGISQIYGIEAAHKVIVKEVTDVFKMYGITVNQRHLLLIAEYMTYNGWFQPLSRKGMEDSASPLQQMSFESSLAFLKNATLRGKQDDLESPSSRLMLGQPCKSGTGMCSLLVKIQKPTFTATLETS